MFEVNSGGGSSVRIATKNDTLWVDPSTRHTADKGNEVKDVVQIATQPHLLQEQVGDKPRLEGPGEYEVGSYALRGFAVQSFDGSSLVTSYRLEINEVAIWVLGNGSAELSEDQFEMLGLVDILVLPVSDGLAGVSPHQAAHLVRRIEPKLVLPIGIAVKDTTQEPSSAALADFVKELGAPTQDGGRIKIKTPGDLPAVLTVVLPE